MIHVDKLTKYFGELRALDNINLQVTKGSIYGLIGPNGSGKTTLIKTIMGILIPDQGQVLLNGQDIHSHPQAKCRVGYVADYQNYYAAFSVKDMIRLYQGSYAHWNQARFEQLHRIFNLPLKKRVNKLSKGMRTQLALLLNLSIEPQILVLDEPSSGLDPVLRRQLFNILMEEVAQNQTTVFISSHNLGELEGICDQIGVIHNGGILFDEKLDDLKTRVRKIQVAFDQDQELDPELFNQPEVLKIEQQGRVYNIVVRENMVGFMAGLKKHQPILLETIDMSLEDIFIYQMGGVGYGFEQIFTQ